MNHMFKCDAFMLVTFLIHVVFSPTSEIDDGGAQHKGGGSPHPLD
jgi:hypothetical protein